MLTPVVRLGWDVNSPLVVSAREVRTWLGVRSDGQRDSLRRWFEGVANSLKLIEGQDFRNVGTDYLIRLEIAREITVDSGGGETPNDHCLDLQELSAKKWLEFKELLIYYRCWETPEVVIKGEILSVRRKSKQGEMQIVVPGNTSMIRTLMDGTPLAHVARIWKKEGLIKHLVPRRVVLSLYDVCMVNAMVIMRKQWQDKQDK